jgi:ribosomal protein L37AE/L43A
VQTPDEYYRAADKPGRFKFADRLARFTRKPERRIVRFMDLFSCPKCGAKYRVKRLYWQSSKAPVCESCGADFPKTESGAWLLYERADPVNQSGGGRDGGYQT